MKRAVGLILLLVIALPFAGAATSPAGAAAPIVRLSVFDATGHALSFADTIDIITNGGKGWRNDATYRSGDGTIVDQPALFNDGGEPEFRLTELGVGLTLAWRTAHTGYSTLFIDNLGSGFSSGGTVNLTYRAALDYRAKLNGRWPDDPPTFPRRASSSGDRRRMTC